MAQRRPLPWPPRSCPPPRQWRPVRAAQVSAAASLRRRPPWALSMARPGRLRPRSIPCPGPCAVAWGAVAMIAAQSSAVRPCSTRRTPSWPVGSSARRCQRGPARIAARIVHGGRAGGAGGNPLGKVGGDCQRIGGQGGVHVQRRPFRPPAPCRPIAQWLTMPASPGGGCGRSLAFKNLSRPPIRTPRSPRVK